MSSFMCLVLVVSDRVKHYQPSEYGPNVNRHLEYITENLYPQHNEQAVHYNLTIKHSYALILTVDIK